MSPAEIAFASAALAALAAVRIARGEGRAFAASIILAAFIAITAVTYATGLISREMATQNMFIGAFIQASAAFMPGHGPRWIDAAFVAAVIAFLGFALWMA
ncbi:MAG: hypothetical protein ACE5FS_15815 [Paracoccaceae bacterium]